MGKLDRLLRLAKDALDLDEGRDRRRDHDPRGHRAADAREGRPDGRYAPPAPHPAWRDVHAAEASRHAAQNPYAPPAPGAPSATRPTDADRAAIARYDYLMQTADPHRIEQIHREAFARLTPAQRTQIQERMTSELAPTERPASSSPEDLARAAGRTEAGAPGRMRGLLSRVRGSHSARSGGIGGLGVMGGAAVGVLGVVAAGAVTSTVAGPLLEQAAGLGVDFDALAHGVDLEAIASGAGFDDLSGVAEGVTGAAEGVVGSAGEAVSGLGDTASDWGQRLGDLGIPGIGDLFGR